MLYHDDLKKDSVLDKIDEKIASAFGRNTLGFSTLFIKELSRNQNFPKYSIYNSKTPPYSIIIEVALAGYGPGDLYVNYDTFALHIGTQSKGDGLSGDYDDGRDYQYNGIARRDFQLRFLLAPNCIDVTAHFKLGILTVEVEFAGEQTPATDVEIGDCPVASKYKASYPENSKHTTLVDLSRQLRNDKLIKATS